MKKMQQFSDWIQSHWHTITLVTSSAIWTVVGIDIAEHDWLFVMILSLAGIEYCWYCRKEYMRAVESRRFYELLFERCTERLREANHTRSAMQSSTTEEYFA